MDDRGAGLPATRWRTWVLAGLALSLAGVLAIRLLPNVPTPDRFNQTPPWSPCPHGNSDIALFVDRFSHNGRVVTVHVVLRNLTKEPLRISGFSLASLGRGGLYATSDGVLLLPDTLDDLMLHPVPYTRDLELLIAPESHAVTDLLFELQASGGELPNDRSVLWYQLRGEISIADINYENTRWIHVCGEGRAELE